MSTFKHCLYLTTSTIFILSGCTSPSTALKPSVVTQTYEKPTAEKQNHYEQTMRKVASGIQEDANYQRIALDTAEKKAWFKSLTYRLWDRQITRYQFMAEGLSKYPTHKYEFEFVVKGFTFL